MSQGNASPNGEARRGKSRVDQRPKSPRGSGETGMDEPDSPTEANRPEQGANTYSEFVFE